MKMFNYFSIDMHKAANSKKSIGQTEIAKYIGKHSYLSAIATISEY